MVGARKRAPAHLEKNNWSETRLWDRENTAGRTPDVSNMISLSSHRGTTEEELNTSTTIELETAPWTHNLATRGAGQLFA